MKPPSVREIEDHLCYASLRAAFLLTLDELLRYSLAPGRDDTRSVDLMHFYPPLRGMAPQVQLECILRTWQRFRISTVDFPSPLDSRILHASNELLASLAADGRNPMLRVVFEGPRDIQSVNDHWLVARIRCLQISRDSDNRRAIYRELAASAPADSSMPAQTSGSFDPNVMETLGKWRVSADLHEFGHGLLTAAEKELVRDFFEEHSALTE